jgi:hypothetical protein
VDYIRAGSSPAFRILIYPTDQNRLSSRFSFRYAPPLVVHINIFCNKLTNHDDLLCYLRESKESLYKYVCERVTDKWVCFVIFYGTQIFHFLSPKYGKGLC